MHNYQQLLGEILETGIDKEGRNGLTRGLFARQLRFKMENGFPAVTTKKLAFRSTAAELFFFMSGCSDNKVLQRLGCEVWTANSESDYWKHKAKYEGDLGRIYGVQWRSWRTPDDTPVDQLQLAINKLKKDPNDRRNIVTAWNPGELDQMALPPCHMQFQLYVANKRLSLHMYQRSCDMFLGVPFNIASYALLLHLLAQMSDLIADELILTLADVHIYENHFDAVKEQLTREPYTLPNLWINPDIKSLDNIDVSHLMTPDDITKLVRLEDYRYHSAIKAPMSV